MNILPTFALAAALLVASNTSLSAYPLDAVKPNPGAYNLPSPEVFGPGWIEQQPLTEPEDPRKFYRGLAEQLKAASDADYQELQSMLGSERASPEMFALSGIWLDVKGKSKTELAALMESVADGIDYFQTRRYGVCRPMQSAPDITGCTEETRVTLVAYKPEFASQYAEQLPTSRKHLDETLAMWRSMKAGQEKRTRPPEAVAQAREQIAELQSQGHHEMAARAEKQLAHTLGWAWEVDGGMLETPDRGFYNYLKEWNNANTRVASAFTSASFHIDRYAIQLEHQPGLVELRATPDISKTPEQGLVFTEKLIADMAKFLGR